MTVSSKIRIYDLAKELRVDTKRLIEDVRREGISIRVPSNSISSQLAEKIRIKYRPRKNAPSNRARATKKNPSVQTSPLAQAHPSINSVVVKRPTKDCPLCTYSCHSRSALNIHFLEDHSNNVISGALRRHFTVSEVATGLGVDTDRILEAATLVGYEFIAESDLVVPDFLPKILTVLAEYKESVAEIQNRLGSDVFVKIQRKRFRELRELIDACLRGKTTSKEDEELATNEQQKLLLYVRMLELKVNDKRDANVEFRKKVVRRIAEDIEALETRQMIAAAKRVPWRLLPPGKYSFPRIIQHFRYLSKHRTFVEYDEDRLERIHSLGPDDKYIGQAEFEGYVVFYFCEGPSAVLECPEPNNAIYVFGDNWKSLSRLTKTDLLNSQRDFDRVIHKRGWFSRLKSVMVKRGTNVYQRRMSNY